MTIEQLTNDLDTLLNETWVAYTDAHKELDAYRGKPLDLEADRETVNNILLRLQEAYAELHPVFHFITYRHQFAANAMHGYANFVEALKKAGAMETNVEHA